MPAAKGLFHRAAIQSGSWLRGTPREDANETTKMVLQELGISASNIDEIQRVPVQKLLAIKAGALGPLPPRRGTLRMGFAPVVDGKVLPSHPFDPIATPVSADIPLLVGCTEYESTLFYLADESVFSLDDAGMRKRIAEMIDEPMASRAIDTYRKAHPKATPSDVFLLLTSDRLARMDAIRLAERKHAQGKAPVFMFLFTWNSPALGGKLRSPHTVEIPFVFDNTDIPTVMTKSPTAKALAAKTSDAWIAFARSGDPNHSGLPKWPAYTPTQRPTMVLDNTCHVVDDPGSQARKLWITT
jgi:para-nitrobenzyl esterase